MKYKGIELKEFTSDKTVVFDPPKKMLVWDKDNGKPIQCDVLMYHPRYTYPVICADDSFRYCAEIPELKPRRATNRELAKWLAQGKGEKKYVDDTEPDDGCFYASIEFTYACSCADDSVAEEFFVRKWDDDEWHEPTADYMGLED